MGAYKSPKRRKTSPFEGETLDMRRKRKEQCKNTSKGSECRFLQEKSKAARLNTRAGYLLNL